MPTAGACLAGSDRTTPDPTQAWPCGSDRNLDHVLCRGISRVRRVCPVFAEELDTPFGCCLAGIADHPSKRGSLLASSRRQAARSARICDTLPAFCHSVPPPKVAAGSKTCLTPFPLQATVLVR